MSHSLERLWHNPEGSKLLVLVPGTTGLGFPSKRGFAYLAATLWAAGISTYFSNTSGQDGRIGDLDMAQWADETNQDVASLKEAYGFLNIDFLGSCLGGPVAAMCAANNTGSQLFLWETALAYGEGHRADFVTYCQTQGITVSRRFWNTLIELRSAVSLQSRATFYHGTDLKMPFTGSDLSLLRSTYPSWRFKEVHGANHGFPRGSKPPLLPAFCDDLKASILQPL